MMEFRIADLFIDCRKRHFVPFDFTIEKVVTSTARNIYVPTRRSCNNLKSLDFLWVVCKHSCAVWNRATKGILLPELPVLAHTRTHTHTRKNNQAKPFHRAIKTIALIGRKIRQVTVIARALVIDRDWKS